MVLDTQPIARTGPEDWTGDIQPGSTYTFDAMHFPFPLTPLTASTLGPCFANGATAGLQSAGAPIKQIHVVHRNFYRYEWWEPFVPESEQQAREMEQAAAATMQTEVSRLAERWHGEHLPRLHRLLQRLADMERETASTTELHPLIDEANGIYTEFWKIHFQIVGPMTLAMQLFDEFHADVVGGHESDGHALLIDTPSKSLEAAFGLSDLAARARSLGVADVITSGAPGDVRDLLQQTPAGVTFLVDLDDYLQEFGLRQDLFELATPTWLEDPSMALATIRTYLVTGLDPRADHAEKAAAARRAVGDVRKRLEAYPEAIREHFEALLQAGTIGAFLQEQHNFYIDQNGTARLRFFYLGIGRRLVQGGVLDDESDIMMLSVDEIKGALGPQAGQDGDDGIRTLVASRRARIEAARSLTPPPFIGEPPSGPPPTGNPMQRAMVRFFGGPPQQAEHPGQLKGNGGSRGIVTGRAFVARTLEEASAIQPGDILVAITTMPPWTPLFGIAAAVVTETGGALSHCAIVAREYGIPAVVGAHGATSRIESGQLITVDGTTGIVTLNA